MAIQTKAIEYQGPDGPLEGVLAWDDAADQPRPGVLVAHNVMGLDDFDIGKAKALAALGYVGFAMDNYGKDRRANGEREKAFGFMEAASADRRLLEARLKAGLATARAQPQVDATRIAGIGFCFGGKCMLDLARAGTDMAGVVSFHGVFDPPPYPNAAIRAKVLILHGFEDPLATPEQATALGHELTASGADWQIHLYGGVGHAFTAQMIPPIGPGFDYDEQADRRSWQAMRNFLGELFG